MVIAHPNRFLDHKLLKHLGGVKTPLAIKQQMNLVIHCKENDAPTEELKKMTKIGVLITWLYNKLPPKEELKKMDLENLAFLFEQAANN